MGNRDESTSIEAAAARTRIDVRTIRKWVADGLLHTERRGGSEVVSVSDVNTVASWETSRKNSAQKGTIRGLLRETTQLETRDVSELQQLARDRIR
jgi:DNA-binding transcriptional MerR regulator